MPYLLALILILVIKMKKRIIIIYSVFLCVLMALVGRIYYISQYQYTDAAVCSHSRVEYFGSNRGLILDCNFKKLVENDIEIITPQFDSNAHFTVNKRYSDNQICTHFIGYLNAEGEGVSGIEKDYNSFLSSIKNEIKITYNLDAKGNLLLGNGTNIDKSGINETDGVVTTIDAVAQNSVKKYCGELTRGAVVLLDSETAEIRAAESIPSINENNLEESLNSGQDAFLNRCISNYSVGSIFKIIVCAAALESGYHENYTYECSGFIDSGGIRFNCHKLDGHGKLSMKEAMQESCNPYFINLAKKIGYKKILDMCKKMGIDESIVLSDSIICEAGNLPSTKILSSPAGLSNFAFGQGELLSSPLKFCQIYAAVDNNGILNTPTFIKGTIRNGVFKENEDHTNPIRIFSKKTAQIIKKFLTATVIDGTGKNAYSNHFSVSGKTATAQTGRYQGNKEILYSYFVGSFEIKDKKYTMLVMKEDGNSGSTDCAPIFKKISEDIFYSVNNIAIPE